MPVEWFIVQNGLQSGPIAEEELKARAAAGTFRPEELIWNNAMPEWMPAGQATDWTFGPAPAGIAVAGSSMPSQLAYAAKTDEPLVLSPRTFDIMKGTGPWVRFFAVLSYIFAGICLLMGVVMTIMGLGGRSLAPPGAALGVVYLILGVLYAFPASYLNRYASRIARLTRMRRTLDLEEALDAQRAFWRFCGILAIIVIGLYILGIAIAIGFGAFWRR